MIAKAGDIYCVYNELFKKYTACQVTKVDDSGKNPQAIILSLDWFGDKLPELEDLAAVTPLYIDYMYWNRALHMKKVDISVPPNYVCIGNLTPINNDDTDIYGSWSKGMKYIISLYGKKFLKINEILLRKQMKVMSL